jgi:O-acetyl-ADP-ribose deacetylase (regulator of RNase III)
MVREVRAYEPRNLQRVVFAVFGDHAEEAFRRALGDPQD